MSTVTKNIFLNGNAMDPLVNHYEARSLKHIFKSFPKFVISQTQDKIFALGFTT